MSKIIIDNRTTKLNDLQCCKLVTQVIEMGRVSNNKKQYAYATSFKNEDLKKEYMVYTDLNKKSDRFLVVDR